MRFNKNAIITHRFHVVKIVKFRQWTGLVSLTWLLGQLGDVLLQ